MHKNAVRLWRWEGSPHAEYVSLDDCIWDVINAFPGDAVPHRLIFIGTCGTGKKATTTRISVDTSEWLRMCAHSSTSRIVEEKNNNGCI